MGSTNHPYNDLDIEAEFAHRQEERARLADKIQADVDYWLDQQMAEYLANQPFIEDTLDYLMVINPFNTIEID